MKLRFWRRKVDCSVSVVNLLSEKKDLIQSWSIGTLPGAVSEPAEPKEAEDLFDLYLRRKTVSEVPWSHVSDKYSLWTKRQFYDEESVTPLNYMRQQRVEAEAS